MMDQRYIIKQKEIGDKIQKWRKVKYEIQEWINDPCRIVLMPECNREICLKAIKLSNQAIKCGPELSGENEGFFWLYGEEEDQDCSSFWEKFDKLKNESSGQVKSK